MILLDTHTVCEVCGANFMGDGYQWTCDDCRHPKKECPHCGSDDVICDWHIDNDQNGELMWQPVWYTECQKCERRTIWFETAKDAHSAWMNGEVFTPIEGTGHYEEVW